MKRRTVIREEFERDVLDYEDILNCIVITSSEKDVLKDIVLGIETTIKDSAVNRIPVNIPCIGLLSLDEGREDALSQRKYILAKREELSEEAYKDFRTSFIGDRLKMRKEAKNFEITSRRAIKRNGSRYFKLFKSGYSVSELKLYFYLFSHLEPIEHEKS